MGSTSMKRPVRLLAGTISVVVGFAVMPALVAVAAPAARLASTPHPAQGKQATLGAPRKVNLKALSGVPAGAHPHLVAPFLSAHTGHATSAPRRAGVTVLRASAPQAADTAITAFSVMSLARQFGIFGPDQLLQPPDTQLAAGPGAVLEMVNDTASVWSKTGTLLADADLNVFFGVPGTQSFSDPRVLYDTSSGRWFVSGFSFDNSFNSRAYLAVSASSDPLGNFFVYTVNTAAGVVSDQPMTGVCDDKVVMSWNDFTTPNNPVFTSAQTLVLQKSSLLAGATVNTDSFTSTTDFRLVPAQSLSATSTCWLTENKADTALAVFAVTGTPDATNVAMTETDLPVSAFTAPPAPHQPSGVTNDKALDERLLSAVYRDGLLWTSGTDGCKVSSTSPIQDCMRLIEASAASPTPSLLNDIHVTGPVGTDQYYPAVSLDNSDNLFVSYSQSSAAQFPGAFAVTRVASSGTFTTPLTIAAGRASYDGGGTPRWGDYSAAAPDPALAGAVWVTGEYAPSDAASGDWGTATAEASLTAPPARAIAVGAEGGNGALYAQAPQLGGGWHSLGGTIIAAPAVAARPNPNGTTPAQPLFVATAADHTLWVRSLSAGWQRLGPETMSCLNGPAAVITGASILTLACEGLDRALWVNSTTWTGSGLPTVTSAWTRLGGVLANGPAAAPVGGTMTYFVPGTNGQIFTRTNAAGYTARPWVCIGRPAAAAEPASSDTIFGCQGSNHALWVAANGGTGWTPAVSLGGSLIGGPAVAAASHVTDLLVEGSNQAVYVRTPLSGYVSLGGVVVGGVGAAGLN